MFFCRYLGTQLHPISLDNRENVASLLVNLSVNFSVLYCLRHDAFHFKYLMSLLESKKPLFSFAVKNFVIYGQLMLTFFNGLFYLLRGPQITQLLNGVFFSQVYQSRRQAACAIVILILSDTFQILVHFPFQISEFVEKPKTLFSTFSMVTLIIHSINGHLVCNLLFYQQYATRKILGKMVKTLETNSPNLGKRKWGLQCSEGFAGDFIFPFDSQKGPFYFF